MLLYDTLSVQKSHKMELPAWTVSVFPDRLRPFMEQGFALYTTTKYMKTIKGGPLVTKIVNEMQQFQSDNSSRTVHIYSGHDFTLVSVMRLLDLTNQTTGVPEYGATLAFELHDSIEDGLNQLELRVSISWTIDNCTIYFMNIFPAQQIVYYFDFNEKKPKQLTIPNCPAPCMLDQFVKSIKFVLDFDYANACKLDDEDSIHSSDNE